MPERRRSAATVAAAAVLVASTLVGCVGIPTSGAVTVGEAPTEQDAGDLEFLPFGPTPGATQEEIVRGFIDAFTSSAGDYGVARDYLSAGFEREWDPQAGVIVRAVGSTDPLASVDGDSLRYTVSAAAAVDETGAFLQSDTPESVQLGFDLVEESGEWRISQAPAGIVLSDALFQRIYSEHAVYFLAPAGDRLVPDLRWFAGGTATLRIVSALLAGPPEWLQGAVRTAFPDGTQLEGVSPRSDGGVVVDLSEEANTASTRDRALMQVQLRESLAGIANLGSTSLSAGGTPLEGLELGAAAPQANPTVDDRAVVGVDGAFGYLSAGEVAPIGQLSAKVVAAGATAATLSADVEAAAVLGPAGVSVARTGNAPLITVDAREGLVPPSLDPYDFVWSTTATSPASIRIIDFDGVTTDLPTNLPVASEVVSVDVSRDGARVAMLLATPVGQRLVVTAVVRDPNNGQRPTRLGAAVLDVSTSGGRPVDAAWIDDVSVATLAGAETANGGSASVARSFVLGGEHSGLGDLPASVAIVGGNVSGGLRAVREDGVLMQRRGNVWIGSEIVVGFVATQQ